jgi:hypothetical protein
LHTCAIIISTGQKGQEMTTYETAKLAAWVVYADETEAAGDNYNARAIALANFYRALENALKAGA